MRAALMQRGRIWVDDLEMPKPGPGELLVRSLACGICGSDLHAAAHTDEFVATSREAGGAFKLTTFDPVVLGHEFAAELVDYGPDTERRLNPGDVLCSVPVLTRAAALPIGYSNEAHGAFAEFFLLSERLALPVPAGTPAHLAALTEPMAVGLHAVRKAAVGEGQTALVLGCGPVGLAVITALKAAGAAAVIATDFSPGRREFAAKQGADVLFDPAQADPFEQPDIRAAKDLVVFECVGVPGMLDGVFLGAPRNARIVVVGVCLQTDHIRPLVAVNKELNVQFVLGYSLAEFAETLKGIAEGTLAVEGLVTGRVGLDEVADAFEALSSPQQHAKIIVEPRR
ncbi:MAG: zinc-binding dehydrogenase [Gammaproteobacteria bacterium]|nr:zinc-binding dehydrogenase [Gammaproteobacteria bacterium]